MGLLMRETPLRLTSLHDELHEIEQIQIVMEGQAEILTSKEGIRTSRLAAYHLAAAAYWMREYFSTLSRGDR